MQFINRLRSGVLAPISSMRVRYVPLLMVYFAYGASSLSNISMSFWVKDKLNLSAAQLASVGIWIMLPWTVKMVWGQLIDNFPILGSRRKAYVFLGAGFTILGLIVLGSLAGQHSWISLIGSNFSVYLLGSVLMAMGFAIQDAAADTMTTEVVPRFIQANEEGGTVIERPQAEVHAELAMVQVLGRLALCIGILSVAKLGGAVAKLAQEGTVITYQTVFWIMLLVPLISSTGAAMVRLEQDTADPKAKRKALNVPILLGGVGLGLLSIVIGFVRILGEERIKIAGFADEIFFVISLAVLAWMVRRLSAQHSLSKRRVLYFTLAALFIYRLIPYTGAGLTWWKMDALGFGPSFFGTLNLIGAITPILVLWLFSDTIARKPVRSILLFLICLGAILSLPELILYYGGPGVLAKAKAIMIFDTALEDPLASISMVPLLTLIALYAPAESRGTWFAVGASLLNVALAGAQLGSKYLNMAFVVTRQVMQAGTNTVLVPADYSHLGQIMIVRILIMLIIPTIAVLLFLPRNSVRNPEF